MKKLKLNLLKKYNSILMLLLTLLGFSTSCENNESPVEYGTPSAKFIVAGKVVSEDNSQAIPQIRVVMGYDTAYSDQEGNYQVMQNYFPTDQSFLLEFEDVDGSENREFQSLDSTVVFKDSEFTGGDGKWYSGEAEKTVNIKLKPKE